MPCVGVTLRLQGPKRHVSQQELIVQFELEDAVLALFEMRMKMYRKGSKSAQVPFLFSTASCPK